MAIQSNIPQKLFHYTDGRGLLGILETGEIWLTHVAYLNDSSEQSYAKELVKSILKELGEDQSYELREEARLSSERWSSVTGDTLSLSSRYYVMSLSTKQDDVNQWRGYSTMGERYCIEFDSGRLLELASSMGTRCIPVMYEPQDIRMRVRDCYPLAYEEHILEKSLRDKDGKVYKGKYFHHLVNERLLENIGAWIKHPAFSEEQEWRLLTEIRNDPGEYTKLQFRSGRSFIIPYTSLTLTPCNSPISGIWVGPSAHPEHSKSALHSLLTSRNWKLGPTIDRSGSTAISLYKSAVPYRDW